MEGSQNPLSQLNKYTEETCPHLGLASDLETRFSYPNWENYCYRVEPAQSISETHQEEMCLTPQYSQCPVYQAEGRKSFPSELKGDGLPLRRRGGFSWWWIGGLIIGAAIAFFTMQPNILFALSITLTPVGSYAPISTPVMVMDGGASTPSNMQEEKSVLSSPTISPTPTISPMPTLTPTVTQTLGPSIGTPFGNDKQYVIYNVSKGDSIGELARTYNTSPEAIRIASNLRQGKEIWPGDLLVIPVGQSNPDQVIRFTPLYLERKTDISVLAERYSVLVEEIRLYNGLGDEEKISGNRWLIIPARGE